MLQARDPLFPFVEFGVTENRILDNLVALIFTLQFAGRPLGLCCPKELALRGINQEGLSSHVDERRRRTFQSERESPGSSQPRTDNELGQVGIARLVIGREGVLLVRSGRGGRRAVREGQLHRALQWQRFSVKQADRN